MSSQRIVTKTVNFLRKFADDLEDADNLSHADLVDMADELRSRAEALDKGADARETQEKRRKVSRRG